MPLSKSCHKDEKQLRVSATLQHNEEFRFDWKPVAIGYACGGAFGLVLVYIKQINEYLKKATRTQSVFLLYTKLRNT